MKGGVLVKTAARWPFILAVVWLAACRSGSQEPTAEGGTDTTPPTTQTTEQRVVLTPLAPGDSTCPHGGTRFTVGTDVTYACNGANGTEGKPGPAGQSVSAELVPVGDAYCPNGGTRFTSSNGVTYACAGPTGPAGPPNGPPGPAGPPGPGALVCRDARGTYVGTYTYGLIMEFTSYSRVYCVNIDERGYEWMYDYPSGRFFMPPAPRGDVFTTPDCTGTSYVDGVPLPRVPFILVGESQLRVRADDQQVEDVTLLSYLEGGVCKTFPRPLDTGVIPKAALPVDPTLTLPPNTFTGPLHRARQ